MIDTLKRILKKSPVPLSKNHGYDLATKKILKKHLKENSNCIDVGAHKGEILDICIKHAPEGKHFAFEPIPNMFENLKSKYSSTNKVTVYPYALSDASGESDFNFVESNPSYSGLQKRKYDRKNETDSTIKIETKRLDELISSETPIDFIKIDVEGGEMLVLKGAEKILDIQSPLILFEHGLGASDVYGFGPNDVFSFLVTKLGYRLFNLSNWLKQKTPLSQKEFEKQFQNGDHYYFVAQK